MIVAIQLKKLKFLPKNILSHNYRGLEIKFRIHNAPLLFDVSPGRTVDGQLRNLINPFRNFLPQFENL